MKLFFVLNGFLIVVQYKPRRNIQQAEMPYSIIHRKPVCLRFCFTKVIKRPCPSIDMKDFETCNIHILGVQGYIFFHQRDNSMHTKPQKKIRSLLHHAWQMTVKKENYF